MINGGVSQHDNSPYYPLPFAPGIVSGVSDSGAGHPQLTPRFTLADGTQLIAAAWMKDIKTLKEGQRYVVSYRMDELDRLGKKGPVKDKRIDLIISSTVGGGNDVSRLT